MTLEEVMNGERGAGSFEESLVVGAAVGEGGGHPPQRPEAGVPGGAADAAHGPS